MSVQARSAAAGREQPCVQCGAHYRPRRITSRYCSPRCIKRAQRSTPRVAPVANGLRAWLTKKGYIGRIGKDAYGLTVPLSLVASDLQEAATALRAMGLRSIAPESEAALRSTLRQMNLACQS